MIKLKTFDEMLEVILSIEEKNERSVAMAGLINERRRIKIESQRQAQSFSSKIKLLDQEVEAEAVILEKGKEFRKVQCQERESENGIDVEIYRMDTWEMVRRRAMTEEERQGDLFAEAKPVTDEAETDDQALAENMANAAAFIGNGNKETEEVNGEAPVLERTEWFSGLSEDERDQWHGAPCVCGHWRGLHEEEGNGRCPAIAPGCKCKAYRCADCDTKGGHQASCSHYVTGEGTPIETELPAEEIERIADLCSAGEMEKIDKGALLKIAHVNGNPYLVNGWVSGGHNKGRELVWAYPVLPLVIVGEENARTRAEAYQEFEKNDFKSPMSYRNVKFNGGSKKNPDWWVIVGDQIRFTVRGNTGHDCEPDAESDDFTASQCDECGRIDGAHDANCVHASKFTYKTYLEFATAQKLKNPASHARKMELSRDRDDEVRAWLESQQGSPADGSLFDLTTNKPGSIDLAKLPPGFTPDPKLMCYCKHKYADHYQNTYCKKKTCDCNSFAYQPRQESKTGKRGKLQMHEETSYAEGL